LSHLGLEQNNSMSLVEVLTALGRPVETACNLIESLLGQPFKIAGDALSDQVRLWQWKNRLRIRACVADETALERYLIGQRTAKTAIVMD
jgi:hypothetical protein